MIKYVFGRMEQPIFKTVWLPKRPRLWGCPIADLIRYNAERGECGPGSVEEHVRKRLHWMKVEVLTNLNVFVKMAV